MIDQTYCYRKNSSIIFKDLPDGPVLIDPYRRTVVSLDPAGLEIWHLIDGSRPVAGIIASLKDMFDAGDNDIERDTISFLKELAKREIIH